MIIYEATKSQFVNDALDRDIAPIILEQFKERTGYSVAQAQIEAWQASLVFMARALRDDSIPADCGIAVEYRLPQSAKMIDVAVTGFDESGRKTAVIVELKQWQRAESFGRDGSVITYLGGGRRETVHPSYQAWSYATLLQGFNTAVYEVPIDLAPCAYLHNYLLDGVLDGPEFSDYISKAPLFFAGEKERLKLRQFIKKHIHKGDNRAILYEIDNGKVRPSKTLADALSGMLKRRSEFVLIDDQKLIFESCKAAAMSVSDATPKVVIVEGGPGTGKSLVAINLLVSLIQKGLFGKYVSKNAAPRAVYSAKLEGSMTKRRFSQLFVGSGTFLGAPENSHDFLVVDEAHRLNEKSGLYYNLGINQVQEIINSTRCAIFFIDEDQRVTLRDIGSVDEIEKFAAHKGARVERYRLSSQFRCSGSDGYLAWLDNILGIRETANEVLDEAFMDFRVFDDPGAMHAEIERLNQRNKARVVAGYCWPWRSKKNPSASDIKIGSYERQWNLSVDGSLWIIAPSSVNQVGCIHTCQGLELDYVGVIVGPDLLVRDGEVITNPKARASQDSSLKGLPALRSRDPIEAQRTADLIIKNTYRTLLTRGMKGCFLYSEDAETRRHFANAVAAA